jgi:hypothetical protein
VILTVYPLKVTGLSVTFGEKAQVNFISQVLLFYSSFFFSRIWSQAFTGRSVRVRILVMESLRECGEEKRQAIM